MILIDKIKVLVIYLRSDIPFQVIDMLSQSPPPNAGEHLIVRLDLGHSKTLLGVLYECLLLFKFTY